MTHTIAAKFALTVAAVLFFGIGGTLTAQNRTIILTRHTEKMPPTDADMGDPDLSPEGRQRAERMMMAIRKYRVRAVFATGYKRTQQTAEPIARMRKLPIETYDPGHPEVLIGKILSGPAKSVMIVGHGNSIPVLVNLLMIKEIFKQLADNEYGVFWVVRMKKGIVTRVEVFTY
jgi:2,3-bisphosphoglycerate-dependent phosphoglycerate mutase